MAKDILTAQKKFCFWGCEQKVLICLSLIILKGGLNSQFTNRICHHL